MVAGARRCPKPRAACPLGLGALVAGIVLVVDRARCSTTPSKASSRGVVGLVARAVRAACRRALPPRQFARGGVLAVVAVGFAIFAILGPLDRIDKIVVVLAALTMLFIAIDRIAKVLRGEQFDTGLNLCFLWIFLIVFGAIFAGLLPLGRAPGHDEDDLGPG